MSRIQLISASQDFSLFPLLDVPIYSQVEGLPSGSAGKNLPGMQEMLETWVRSQRSPGKGNGNTLQYSCLKSPMDRGAWWATACRVAKGWTWLKRLSMHILGRNLGHSTLHLPYPDLYHTPRSSTRSLLLSDKSTPPGILHICPKHWPFP